MTLPPFVASAMIGAVIIVGQLAILFGVFLVILLSEAIAFLVLTTFVFIEWCFLLFLFGLINLFLMSIYLCFLLHHVGA